MTHDAPWLTIVTIVKDDIDGLTRTMKSLEKQSQRDFEWLVIDGSQDESAIPLVLRGATTSSTYRWEQPRGIYSAMNAGLSMASGEYIYFLNGGDCLHAADSLRDIRGGLSTKPTWLYGQVRFVSADGTSRTPAPFDYLQEREHFFARGRFPGHQGTVARTETLRAIGGFDESYRITADYAVFLRLSRLSDPVELDMVLADFFVGGVSTVDWRLSLDEFRRARREILSPRGLSAALEGWESRKHRTKVWMHHRLVTPLRAARGLTR